ncbi:MAG: hypothetical protein CENE_03141 [Candidatus Celerinatantimonas neptuna]|nr:MAG: hypothetical protein CENE_03141 [Candidatus Celerinatantimonas neptuna]
MDINKISVKLITLLVTPYYSGHYLALIYLDDNLIMIIISDKKEFKLKKIQLIIAILTVITLSGCANLRQQPITPQKLTQIKNRQVSITEGSKPNFLAMSPLDAMFGIWGGVYAMHKGNEIIHNNKIADPALDIASQLNMDMAQKLGTKPVKSVITTPDENVKDIAKRSHSDYVINITTTGWGINYFPFSWDTYRVIYDAHLKLIDTKTAKVIAEGNCKQFPKTKKGQPNYNQMVANHAQKIKQALKKEANACIKLFESHILTI